ncbi:MAG: beta-N-acetylhexosaminidase [Flavipsychrobacter sp.]
MIKKNFLALAISISCIQAFAQEGSNLNIIPAPVSIEKSAGEFQFSKRTLIIADSPSQRAVVFLSHYLKDHFATNKLVPTAQMKKPAKTEIILTDDNTASLPAEGYRLTITPEQVIIAGRGAGLFYGVQTFLQLLPYKGAVYTELPCLTIEDYPRFAYRGMHLDVCRHFFSVDFIKKYLDVMAMYKLNNFHWHLTDDQGWRIEIKKYPKLVSVGSKRAQTKIGRYADSAAGYDHTPYGGYYTQDEIRDVVAYAHARFINVIPEIEMPGHSMAAIASYPGLTCDSTKDIKVGETWGGFKDVFCPSEYTFHFLEDVLKEVMDLFPSKYIHIGGDECNKTMWKHSAFCQDLMKQQDLKNEEELQSYFIQRIEKFVNANGRSIIGWDEILEGGLAPNATVMSWRGEKGGIAAAQQHHNVIMTPGSGGLYFDHLQSKSKQEPLSIGGYAPLQKVYSYDPVSDKLTADEQKYIIGVQANLWTEYIPTEEKVEYMLLPRMLALSEVAWTPTANKNFQDFSKIRVAHQLAVLESHGYNYRVPTAVNADDTLIHSGEYELNITPPVEGAKTYYSVSSSFLNKQDTAYTEPVTFIIPEGHELILQTTVVTPADKKSITTKTLIENK